jgi:hypothetical protein
MNVNFDETARIIIALVLFVFAGSCMYSLTLKSTLTHTTPSQQQPEDQREPQSRE